MTAAPVDRKQSIATVPLVSEHSTLGHSPPPPPLDKPLETIITRDWKEPSLLEFGSVRVLTSTSVRSVRVRAESLVVFGSIYADSQMNIYEKPHKLVNLNVPSKSKGPSTGPAGFLFGSGSS